MELPPLARARPEKRKLKHIRSTATRGRTTAKLLRIREKPRKFCRLLQDSLTARTEGLRSEFGGEFPQESQIGVGVGVFSPGWPAPAGADGRLARSCDGQLRVGRGLLTGIKNQASNVGGDTGEKLNDF